MDNFYFVLIDNFYLITFNTLTTDLCLNDNQREPRLKNSIGIVWEIVIWGRVLGRLMSLI